MQINICFGISDNYCQHCACTIASILYNSNPKDKYNFYIISGYISEMNKKNFEMLKHLRNFNITFLEVNVDEYLNLDVNNQLGPSSFFRFKAFELFDFDKIIYLDVDLIVRKDIAQLYETDIEGYYCAGAEDLVAPRKIKEYNLSPDTNYINAGVMLLNLKYCKENNVPEMLSDFLSQPWDRQWNDQDILNYLFQNKIKFVDIKWNCTYYASMYKNQEYFHQMAKDPSIIHYIGYAKPWLAGMRPHLKSDYFKYLKMTPWFDDFMLGYQLEENSLILSRLDELKHLIISMNK